MQKAIVISGNFVNELNKLLSEGWIVVHSCPMPSATASSYSTSNPTCLVIVSKPLENEAGKSSIKS